MKAKRNQVDIGSLIREARKRTGMTQVEVCQKIGRDQSRLSWLERNGNCNVRTLAKVADALGLELVIELR